MMFAAELGTHQALVAPAAGRFTLFTGPGSGKLLSTDVGWFQSGTFEMKTGAAELVVVHNVMANSMTVAILRQALVLMFASPIKLEYRNNFVAITSAIAVPADFSF
jgi:hypothetical protein